jgi:hypothetical protein
MNAKDATQVVDHFAKELAGQFHVLAPEALKILCEVKQIDSISSILISSVWIVISIILALVLWLLGVRCWREADRLQENYEDLGFNPFYAVVGCLGGPVFAIIAVINAVALSNQWLWIGALHPELAVYHDIIVKVMGQ